MAWMHRILTAAHELGSVTISGALKRPRSSHPHKYTDPLTVIRHRDWLLKFSRASSIYLCPFRTPSHAARDNCHARVHLHCHQPLVLPRTRSLVPCPSSSFFSQPHLGLCRSLAQRRGRADLDRDKEQRSSQKCIPWDMGPRSLSLCVQSRGEAATSGRKLWDLSIESTGNPHVFYSQIKRYMRSLGIDSEPHSSWPFKSRPVIRYGFLPLFSGPRCKLPQLHRESRRWMLIRCDVDPFAGCGASRRFQGTALQPKHGRWEWEGEERSHLLRLEFPP